MSESTSSSPRVVTVVAGVESTARPVPVRSGRSRFGEWVCLNIAATSGQPVETAGFSRLVTGRLDSHQGTPC
jgi:hypothetical protein